MAILEGLELLPWGEYTHRYSRKPATDVPVLLRALAEHGPAHVISFDVTEYADYKQTVTPQPRPVATHLHGLMSVSPVTPLIVPFLVELIGAHSELPTRRVCVRWLQSFFKHTCIFPAGYELEPRERVAAQVASMGLPRQVLRGSAPDGPFRDAKVDAALEIVRAELGEHAHLPWELERKLGDAWSIATWKAIAEGLEVVMQTLEGGDEALSSETIALLSWLPQRAALIAPRLESVVQKDQSSLLGTMALLALARLEHPGVGTAIQVMGDSLESRGERGAPAIYLAAADVLASKGLAGPKSRKALLKVAPDVARMPDPFGTTMAELVKAMAARLVWPKR